MLSQAKCQTKRQSEEEEKGRFFKSMTDYRWRSETDPGRKIDSQTFSTVPK
jgi:hypothetical protein